MTKGMEIEFIFKNGMYKMDVVAYDTKSRKLKVKLNGEIKHITSYCFKAGSGVESLIGLRVMDYRYNKGNIVDVKGNKLKIIDAYKTEQKMYKYECINCGNIDIVSEEKLILGKGCNVCSTSPKKVLVGYNDIGTTHKEILKYLKNKDDAFKYSKGSNKFIDCVCPDCKKGISVSVSKLTSRGFKCKFCGDGFSFPNKFISNVLNQLGVAFETEKGFSWSLKYRYDFYLTEYNIIIEAHGMQHYLKKDSSYFKAEKIRKIDDEKFNLALKNGVSRYIVLDCSESTKDKIYNSIINSELKNLFDLHKVNWESCSSNAHKSLYIKVINHWNNGLSIKDISILLKINKATVRNYLKEGNSNFLCVYDGRSELVASNTRHAKKVKCLEDGLIFNSISECADFYNVSRKHVAISSKKFLVTN